MKKVRLLIVRQLGGDRKSSHVSALFHFCLNSLSFKELIRVMQVVRSSN